MPSHSLQKALLELGIDNTKLEEKLPNLPGAATKVSSNAQRTGESIRSTMLVGDSSDIIYFIKKTIDNFTVFAAGIAILFIVINALRLTISGLDSEQLGKAKKGLTWSAIGLLLVIFSYVVVRTIILLAFSGETS